MLEDAHDVVFEGVASEAIGWVEHDAADEGEEVLGGEGGGGVVDLAGGDAFVDDLFHACGEGGPDLEEGGVFGREGGEAGAHDAVDAGVGEAEVDERADDGADLGPTIAAVVREFALDGGEDGLEAAADEGEVECFLAVPVEVEGSLADLGGDGDVFEADLVVGPGGEERFGGVEDGVLSVGRCAWHEDARLVEGVGTDRSVLR